ncbi:hypothetical protein [Serratia proteamaculans]|uniref:hypothetical protein n=1 Tax=Serratia proteamaculans TaxID=28151 RepID=UPI003CFD7793
MGRLRSGVPHTATVPTNAKQWDVCAAAYRTRYGANRCETVGRLHSGVPHTATVPTNAKQWDVCAAAYRTRYGAN